MHMLAACMPHNYALQSRALLRAQEEENRGRWWVLKSVQGEGLVQHAMHHHMSVGSLHRVLPGATRDASTR